MDFRPPNLLLLLLLTSHLLFVQCDTGQPDYTIDGVDLSIQPSTTVQSGGLVTIGCKVRVSHANIPNLTHTFEIKRDGAILHSSTTTEDSVAYELNPARAADSGDYDCRVTVKGKNRASSNLNLNVTGLQAPILYLSKTTLYKDEDFRATCSAPEEKGVLMFSFFQIFQNKAPEKLAAQLVQNGNSSETTLALKHEGNYTLYCDYEIILHPEARRSNHSNKIEMEVKEAQISLSMDVKPHHEVFEGDLLEVGCIVTTSLKNVEIFLKNNTNILHKAYGSFNRQFRIYESGKVMCKAEWNSVQKEIGQEIPVKGKYRIPPLLKLFSKPNLTLGSVELFERDRMTLACSVSHYARERIRMENIKFSIYRNNTLLTPSQNYITTAHPAHNGNYTCQAQFSNREIQIVKESQTFVVNAKVLVSNPVLSVVGDTLVLGKSFQVLCSSNSGSLPITYILWRPGGRVGETRVVSTPGEQAIFNCSAIFERSLLKNFICHAKNGRNRPPAIADGSQLLHSTTIIEPVSEPVLTIAPNMGDVSEGQDVTLFCSVQRGTLPIVFTWKSASTKVERLSLTQAEVNEAANETDDQNSVTDPEPQYKEVKTSQADPNRAPVETGTDTAYNEVRNSKQGVPERADGTSVEYAQLNHDTDHYGDHGEHGNFSVQDEHVDTIDNSIDTNTADHGE
ncbi:hypothetical protein INR49_011282 [Caranx melampygus]|nr:hypothetical protein INR49_011282 [Caranx melampygus]